MSFTLADIVNVTGAKRRSVQLWADGGAIKAEPATERAGSGTHRVFSRGEVMIACILTALAKLNAPIGDLITAGAKFRDHLLDLTELAGFEGAVRGEIELVAFYSPGLVPTIWRKEHATWFFDQAVIPEITKVSVAQIIYLNPFLAGLRNYSG